MSASDRARWEERWRQRQGPPGAPEPFLVRSAASLPKGPVLVAAAGEGRNALWLAAQGRKVTAIDVAPTAIERLKRVAADRGLAVAARVADLDEPEALAGLGPFAALIVVRFRPSPAQWPALLESLRPGGRLLLCSFGLEQHRRQGFPRAFCLEREEITRELTPALQLLEWQSFAEDGALIEGSLWERPPDA